MQYRRQHRGFTAEAISNMRHRYENTDEPQALIAADFGVHRRTLDSLAKAEGWTLRKDRAQRDLPPDLRLAVDAERIIRADAEARIAMEQSGAEVEQAVGQSRESGIVRISIADRLERAVEKELAAVEIARATLGSESQLPADAERTSRILERLTDTLFKVRRLRSPDLPMAGVNDIDDMPRDIDEFRRGLARRIEAFVRGRADGSLSETGAPSGTASPQP